MWASIATLGSLVVLVVALVLIGMWRAGNVGIGSTYSISFLPYRIGWYRWESNDGVHVALGRIELTRWHEEIQQILNDADMDSRHNYEHGYREGKQDGWEDARLSWEKIGGLAFMWHTPLSPDDVELIYNEDEDVDDYVTPPSGFDPPDRMTMLDTEPDKEEDAYHAIPHIWD
jgi:hypothetical protein